MAVTTVRHFTCDSCGLAVSTTKVFDTQFIPKGWHRVRFSTQRVNEFDRPTLETGMLVCADCGQSALDRLNSK